MATRILGPTRSRRRRRFLFVPILIVSAVALMFVAGAQAVHDENFQLDGDVLVKHLVPVLTLLRDAGYSDDEALRWLTTEDQTLPGTPLQALHENRATEIKRRAQALGL